MIGNALKPVYKYIGLCIIGTLVCTVYTPSAYAKICFLPGNNCVDELPPPNDNLGGYSAEPEPSPGPGRGPDPDPVPSICSFTQQGSTKSPAA